MNQRTTQQNRALHLGCQQIANELVGAGISLEIALRGLDVAPTMESIKDIFRSIAGAKYGVTSTSELQTNQIDEVWRDLTKALSENTGVAFNFPSQQTTQEALESLDRMM